MSLLNRSPRFSVYVVWCQTPRHVYVGQTRQPWRRFANHSSERGAKFVRQHGYKRHEVVDCAATREDAVQLETYHAERLHHAGYVVGGVSLRHREHPKAKP